MRTRIYFVRHCEPDFSVREDRIRPLTEKGHQDATLLVERLLNKNIVQFYSSPYERTMDTVRPSAKAAGLEILQVEDFRERAVGGWVEDFKAFAEMQWQNFEFKLEGGECLREVQERNVRALENLLQKHRGQCIGIGCHGTALCTLIHYFNPMFGFEQFMEIADKMPYILCFEFEDYTLMQIEIIE